MAGPNRMTIEEVVRQVLRDEHADVIRESVRVLTQEMMEAEVSELIAPGSASATPKAARRIATATGRAGGARGPGSSSCGSPSCGRARISLRSCSRASAQSRPWWRVVQQAHVCGVPTRRVDQLVNSLGLRMFKSEVSRIAGLLDEQVTAFRERPLEGRYPWVHRRCEGRSATEAGWSGRPS